MTKWYIAGPMSGYPQHNFPLFDRVRDELLEQGYDVVSPADLDMPGVREASMEMEPLDIVYDAKGNHSVAGYSWGEFLARDVQLIADSDIGGIVFLPNWYRSRGAKLEAYVGLLQKGFEFMRWVDGVPQHMSRELVKRMILNHT